jgi:hypothetical protein
MATSFPALADYDADNAVRRDYLRLNPSNLPHNFRYRLSDGRGEAPASVHLTAERVRIRRPLPSGIMAALDLPVGAFAAVAVRILPGPRADSLTVVVELMHADPALSVPLAIAADLDGILADWRAWGRVFRLPLVLVEADGLAHVVENRLGAVTLKALAPRRRSVLNRRRPRFLAQRQVGAAGPQPVHAGEREIIARN